MLKPRYLIALAIVLVVLLVVKFVQDSRHERATSSAGVDTVIAGPLSADDLGSITVGYGREPAVLVLQNQPDGWVVASAFDARANMSRIESLLENLDGLQGEFRSDHADVLPDYGFTDSTTVTIVGRDRGGAEVFALEVGNKPQGAVGNFVKRRGDTTVYLAAAPVLNQLGIYGQKPEPPQARHFLDLQALKLDRNEVAAIALHEGDDVITLEKEFPEPEPVPADTTSGDEATPAPPPEPEHSVWEWRLTGRNAAPAAKTRADGLLNAVTTIRAADVADPTVGLAEYGLDAPTRWAVITMLDGSESTLEFGAERPAADGAPAGIYLRVDDDPTIWVVSDYVAKNIFKTREDLLPSED